jgi:hypothetical protein
MKLEIFSTRQASQQHQHEAENLQHKAGISTTSQHEARNLQHKVDITTTSTRSWKSSALGWYHNTTPLSREVLLDYTKLISKVLKLYTRQRLGQHIDNLFIHANIMELYGFSLQHITNEVIPDLYVLRLIMEQIIFIQLWLSHRITMASISRSNRSVNNIRSYMASPLAEHAAIYSASAVLGEILDCFLLYHEVTADPILKQHPEVIFLS